MTCGGRIHTAPVCRPDLVENHIIRRFDQNSAETSPSQFAGVVKAASLVDIDRDHASRYISYRANCLANQKLPGSPALRCCELGASAGSWGKLQCPAPRHGTDLTPHRLFGRNTRRQHTDLGRGPSQLGPFSLPSRAPIALIRLRPCPQVSAAQSDNSCLCLSKRVTCATRLPLAGVFQSRVAKQPYDYSYQR